MKKLTFAIATLSSVLLTACNGGVELEITSLKLEAPLALRDTSGNAVTPSSRGDLSSFAVYNEEDQGRISFKVGVAPVVFRIGSKVDLEEAKQGLFKREVAPDQTGQGVGLGIRHAGSTRVDEEYETSESCTVHERIIVCRGEGRERVCQETDGPARHGRRDVHVHRYGSYETYGIEFLDANRQRIGELSAYYDGVHTSRSEGPCLIGF